MKGAVLRGVVSIVLVLALASIAVAVYTYLSYSDFLFTRIGTPLVERSAIELLGLSRGELEVKVWVEGVAFAGPVASVRLAVVGSEGVKEYQVTVDGVERVSIDAGRGPVLLLVVIERVENIQGRELWVEIQS